MHHIPTYKLSRHIVILTNRSITIYHCSVSMCFAFFNHLKNLNSTKFPCIYIYTYIPIYSHMIFPIFTRYFPYIHREYTPYPLDFHLSQLRLPPRTATSRASPGAEPPPPRRWTRRGSPWRPGPGTWGPNGNDVKINILIGV